MKRKRIFPDSVLACDIMEATEANKDPHRRNLQAFRQRAAIAPTMQEKKSSCAAMVEVHPKLSGEEASYEENRNIDYNALLNEELDDDNIRYEDNDE